MFETAALGFPGSAATIHVAFNDCSRLGSHNNSAFGIQPRGPHIRCLRFVITVARVQPYDHARLASGVAVSVVAGGIFTPGHSPKFQGATSFLFDQACPGALQIPDCMVRLPSSPRRASASASA